MEDTTLEIIQVLKELYTPCCFTYEGESCYTISDIIRALNHYFGAGNSDKLQKEV